MMGKLNQELPSWLEVKRGKKFLRSKTKIHNCDEAAKHLSFLRGLLHEEIHVLALDSRNSVMHIAKVAQGGIALSSCHPSDIFRIPIIIGAAGIIMSHNHPSGDSSPSKEDIDMTKKVKEISDILGVRLYDHIIIGNKFHSMFDLGLF